MFGVVWIFSFLLCCSLALCQYSTSFVEAFSLPQTSWSYICSSSNGQTLAATVTSSITYGTGFLYLSNDFGYTWINKSAPFISGYGLACSSDMKYIIVVGGEDYVLNLSSDFGTSWNTTSKVYYSHLAMSGSGEYMYGTAYGGVYRSTNYGGLWEMTSSIPDAYVSCSHLGQLVVLAVPDGPLFFSSNYGTSFTVLYELNAFWTAISMDWSGQYITAAAGELYVSNDFGATFSAASTSNEWRCIAMSSNGSFQIATTGGHVPYYYSEDFGITWIPVMSNVTLSWVISSASSQYLAAVGDDNGGIFINFYSPSSMPSSTPSDAPTASPSETPSSFPTIYQEYSYNLVEMDENVYYYVHVVSSLSGQYIYASVDNLGVLGSMNFGNSLSLLLLLDNDNSATSTACSHSGQYVYVASLNGFIFGSNNYGDTWSELLFNPYANWVSIVTNGSGAVIYAVDELSSVTISFNFGVTWTNSTTDFENLIDIACSASGQYVTVVGKNVSWSDDYGATFHNSDAPVYESWNSIAVSATGQYQIGVNYFAYVFTSTNYGVNWQVMDFDGQGNGFAVTISADGQVMLTGGYSGGVYYSNNYGISWQLTSSPVMMWSGLTLSGNGQYLAGTVFGGGFYTNQYSIPSSSPSSQPSDQPAAAPTLVPSCQPSSQPSKQPHTSFPTSQPSVWPSHCPTSQPSSYPSHPPNYTNVTAVVLSTTANSSYVFSGLGNGPSAYVSVSILVSYLDTTTSGYVSIWATTESSTLLVSEGCAPLTLCGSVTCAVNVDVTSMLSHTDGGSVTLLATTVNANKQSGVDTLCTYKGTPNLQYAMSYSLSVAPFPTISPTVAPTQESFGNFIFEASPNTPFYIIAAVTLLFMTLGVFLVRLADKQQDLTSMKLTTTCYDLGLIGYHLSSELFYIILLFDQQLNVVGSLVLVVRLISVLPAVYFVWNFMGPPHTSKYRGLLSMHNLVKNPSLYSIVIIALLLEITMVRYFPWTASQYSLQSRGFPDRGLFKCCMVTKFCQLFSSLVIQVVVLVYYDVNTIRSNQIELALVLLYLISSVVTVVLFAMTALVRLSSSATTGDDNDVFSSNNPLHYSVDGGAEMLKTMKKMQADSNLTNSRSDSDPEYVSRGYLQERESLLRAEIENERRMREDSDTRLKTLEEERIELRSLMMDLRKKMKMDDSGLTNGGADNV